LFAINFILCIASFFGLTLALAMLGGEAMELLHDSDYHLRLASEARLRADNSDDLDLARRLREAAVLHERKARKLRAQLRTQAQA